MIVSVQVFTSLLDKRVYSFLFHLLVLLKQLRTLENLQIIIIIIIVYSFNHDSN